MYTLASAVRMVDLELQEECLVLVVPAGAAVQISRNEVPSSESQAGVEEWAVRNMRAEILWWADQGKWPHAKKVATVDRATGVAWWADIDTKSWVS